MDLRGVPAQRCGALSRLRRVLLRRHPYPSYIDKVFLMKHGSFREVSHTYPRGHSSSGASGALRARSADTRESRQAHSRDSYLFHQTNGEVKHPLVRHQSQEVQDQLGRSQPGASFQPAQIGATGKI